MSIIEGIRFCDARDRAAMLARVPAPSVPCEGPEGCGAAKGDPCKPAAQPSAPEAPRPWSRDEAFIRLCELAIELRRAGHASAAATVAESASRPEAVATSIGLDDVLGYLHGIKLVDGERWQREVALVRERAEQPALSAKSMRSPCSACGTAHAEHRAPEFDIPGVCDGYEPSSRAPVSDTEPASAPVEEDGCNARHPDGYECSRTRHDRGAEHVALDPANNVCARWFDATPAPAPAVELTDAQKAALRLCALDCWGTDLNVEVANALDVLPDLIRAHLVTPGYDLTDTGRAALAAIDGVVVRGEGA